MNINEYMLGFSFGVYCLMIFGFTVVELIVLFGFYLVRYFIRKRRK